ncbi:nitrate reductase molybdenum cofactor assembly chaperone [Streptomyces gilvifuscus]|uniref:Nitrate reductase molybdenum cofactor assembly chaperone n=1 Tax=Streptomyces gilvifuscus TaxID=1550617 RepID=A0ABT5G0C9_9ACTN|nr:nitrate reductase molybdenum cofactor assembly chaperone [Streptomyces gilvifuscus]MDC2958223.1 nitrate reductase molybdenum cofactor assembly chaperone [Streptomyces gilvifuscus]
MKRKTTRTARTAPWHSHAWQAQSLMLAYPDEQFEQRLALAGRVAATLPNPVARPLLRFTAHAEQTTRADLAAAYVATFDHRKRCCLYLTYYAHGDTRKRGIGLLRLKQTYARAGWSLGDDELPDHLAVVLEFAATDPATGARLLTEHRAGLELLRLVLNDDGSPWAHVLDSVSATLPALAGDEREAVLRLAAQGPPEEQVGLDPYATPVFLPDPVVGVPR